MTEVDVNDVIQAATLLTKKQGHPPLSSGQIFQINCMINKTDSLSQMPTGSGKTYAGICLPDILKILKNQLGYTDFPDQPRVLYIVPLVAIMESLQELQALLTTKLK